MTAPNDPAHTPTLSKGGALVLLEALGERQRRYDNDRRIDSAGPGHRQAMPTEEVRQCLIATGFAGGLDATATELFFGPTGQAGYTDGDEYFATITHGGFILEDPADEEIHEITYRSISGSVIEAASPRHPEQPQWLISARASYYEVQPRFYEDIGQMELLPYAEDVDDPDEAGLASVYPVDEETDVCIDTGAVATNDVRRALELATSLGRVMAEYGVLCDPRVVLLESPGLPLLPHNARLEALHEAQKRHTPDDDGGGGEDPGGKYHLGAPYLPGKSSDPGHRVRQSVSALVPGQAKALSLARKVSSLGAYQRAVDNYRKYLEDPHVPDRRKQDLRRRLRTAAASRDRARSQLEHEHEALAGLLLSILDERAELAKDALPRDALPRRKGA